MTKMVFPVSQEPRANEVLSDVRPTHVIVAYPLAQHLARITYVPPWLLVDPGTFLARPTDKAQDLAGYAHFAKSMTNSRPGLRTRCLNMAGPQDGPADSLQQADFLRAQGLSVVEVFPQGAPWDFLDALLGRLPQGEMIGLAPRKGGGAKMRVRWLQDVLAHLCERHAFKLAELPRCHGLAVGNQACLGALPFYSAEVGTWANAYRFGNVVKKTGRQAHITQAMPYPSSKAAPAQHLATRVNLQNLATLGRWAAELWARRGVRWTEDV